MEAAVGYPRLPGFLEVKEIIWSDIQITETGALYLKLENIYFYVLFIYPYPCIRTKLEITPFMRTQPWFPFTCFIATM